VLDEEDLSTPLGTRKRNKASLTSPRRVLPSLSFPWPAHDVGGCGGGGPNDHARPPSNGTTPIHRSGQKWRPTSNKIDRHEPMRSMTQVILV